MPHLLTDPAVVDLFWNKIGDSGAELLGEALASSSTLTALGLYYSGITAGGAAHIAQGVGRSRSLSTLDLTRNQIGDSGAEALGRALAASSNPHRPASLGLRDQGERRGASGAGRGQERIPR
jgi:Ran GTPase-activating protein (RanGAP) involved in mRNA processing and transport